MVNKIIKCILYFQIIIFMLFGCFIFVLFILHFAEEASPITRGQQISIQNKVKYFESNTITYRFSDYASYNPNSTKTLCTEEDREHVRTAFDILEEKTVLHFIETDEPNETDIFIFCGDAKTEMAPLYSYVTLGESIAYPEINYKINHANIFLYGEIGEHRCENYPSTELHEILHSLGYEHSNNPDDIMYHYLLSCNVINIDQSTIDDINVRYS